MIVIEKNRALKSYNTNLVENECGNKLFFASKMVEKSSSYLLVVDKCYLIRTNRIYMLKLIINK